MNIRLNDDEIKAILAKAVSEYFGSIEVNPDDCWFEANAWEQKMLSDRQINADRIKASELLMEASGLALDRSYAEASIRADKATELLMELYNNQIMKAGINEAL